MKPEIEQKLVEYLTALESLLKDGKDLAIEQAPEVAKEILRYSMASCSAWALFEIACCYVIYRIGVKAYLAMKEDTNDALLSAFPPMLIGGLLFSVFALAAFMNVDQFCKAYFAPRLYVIDYLRSEVKK